MYSATDTIVALATPPGRGGLAVVRVSGPGAVGVCRSLVEGELALEPRRATLVRVAVGSLRDEAIATWFRGPASSTGEDVVELSLHGSPVLAAGVVAGALRAGARMARRGEFTLRAFLNGRLDLSQAEAVNDLASATTAEQARMAFDQLQGTLSERIGAIERRLFELTAKLEASVDFPEEGYHFIAPGDVAGALRLAEAEIRQLLADGVRGRIVREGATAALVGRTNVGKSTVFNRLVGSERAIVTDVPGTTRDLLAEPVSMGGVPVTLIDTAGARTTDDPVEREGVNRALKARGAADLLLVVLDGSVALTDEDHTLLQETASRPRIVLVNKCDLPAAWSAPAGHSAEDEYLSVSAARGDGAADLIGAIARRIGAEPCGESPIISNIRHLELLERAEEKLADTLGEMTEYGQMPEELVLSRIAETRSILEELTGRRTTEELLEEIFSRFCVGK